MNIRTQEKEFRKILNSFWTEYTKPLLRFIRQGGSTKLPKVLVEKRFRELQIQKLNDLVIPILLKRKYNNEYLEKYAKKYIFILSGKGDERWDTLEEEIVKKKVANAIGVYVFLKRKKCKKVGQAQNLLKRMKNHEYTTFLHESSQIIFFKPRKLPRKSLGKLECIVHYLYDPSIFRKKPPHRKGHSRCPLCYSQKRIKQAIRRAFSG